MEYQFFQFTQKIPRWLRVVFGIILLIIGILAAIFPVVPGAFLAIFGVLLLIGARKIHLVAKIRKGVQYLFTDFSWERVRHKFYDIKTHIKHILKERREKNEHKSK